MFLTVYQAIIWVRLSLSGCVVKDYGNLIFEDMSSDEPMGRTKQPRAVGLANKQVADAVKRVKTDGHTCVLLGGDHRFSMSYTECI